VIARAQRSILNFDSAAAIRNREATEDLCDP